MSLPSSLKRFYLAHTGKIRAVLAWLIGGLYLIASNSPDEMASWTAKRWAFEFLTKLGPGFLLLMSAGDRNPAPPAPSAAPDPAPKQAAFAHLGLVLAVLAVLVAAIAVPAFARDPAVVRAFRKANPCPSTGKTSGACPGFVVDHRVPLCAGGPDDVRNMAWQSVADAKWKDGVERQLCARLKACPGP